jgi:hypothetical protein
MDALPSELQDRIVAFSCTDGGPSACSLRLVSRHFHALTIPYRFQSVAIAGLEQLSSFVDQLGATPAGHRCTRHLFFCDITPQLANDLKGQGTSLRSPSFMDTSRNRMRLRDKKLTLHLQLERLLTMISTELVTLTVVIYHYYFDIFSVLAGFTFPRLGSFTYKPPIFAHRTSFDAMSFMSALHTICLAATPGLQELYPLILQLVGGNPKLQHVTLRDVSARPYLILVVRAHLGHTITPGEWAPERLEDWRPPPPPFPRAMARVIVEPLCRYGDEEPPEWGELKGRREDREKALQCLKDLRSLPDEALVLYEPRRHCWNYDEWKREWLGFAVV